MARRRLQTFCCRDFSFQVLLTRERLASLAFHFANCGPSGRALPAASRPASPLHLPLLLLPLLLLPFLDFLPQKVADMTAACRPCWRVKASLRSAFTRQALAASRRPRWFVDPKRAFQTIGDSRKARFARLSLRRRARRFAAAAENKGK